MSAATIARRPSRARAASALAAAAGSPRLPWIVLLAVMAGAVALIMYAGRGTTFFYDDWSLIFDRHAWTIDALLRPHVDHLQAFPTLVYKLMLETVGMQAHWVYRALLAALNVLTAILLFAYARRRVGPWIAIGLASCLVVMADSWYNVLYSFQINFVGGAAAGLGALLALDRRDRFGDALACGLLVVAVGCNSVALPFATAALVEVLWRRDRWRRIWIPGVPVALFGAWWLAYRDEMGIGAHWPNIADVPAWIYDGLDDSAVAIFGGPPEYGPALAVALVGFVVYVAGRPGGLTPRLAALVAMPLVYWALSALGRANQGLEGDTNRYLYVSGLLLALLAVEAARTFRIPPVVAGALTGVLMLGAAASANELESSGDTLRAWSLPGKDAATAYDIAGTLVPKDWGGADQTQPWLRAGPYRAAVADYGPSPGYTREELPRLDPARQLGVDVALTRVHQMAVTPVAAGTRPAGTAPTVRATDGGHTEAAGRGCVRYVPGGEDAALDVEMPWNGILVRAGDAPAEVRIHRFSSLWPEEALGEAAPGTVARVQPATVDGAPEPFAAQVKSKAPFEVCADR